MNDSAYAMARRSRRARIGYVLALLSLLVGGWRAGRAYPDGFDWPYQVMSTLASLQRNPGGGRWFSVCLALAMLLLAPLPRELQRRLQPDRPAATFATRAVQAGLGFGLLMGLERALVFDASSLLYKSHEVLALLCFAGLYIGTFALCVTALCRGIEPRAPVVLILATLIGIGAVQVLLWWTQRGYGWVGRNWRALGIPVWQSFALWQWIAATALLLALGWFSFAPVRARHG
jgi:hypothetical protein